METIEQFAFSGCTGLTEIIIPELVTEIGKNAFYSCAGLKKVIISDNVVTIGEAAFSWCDGLTEITIGAGVKTIEEYVFQGCAGLERITSRATTAPAIGSTTFYNIKSYGTLYIPQDSDYSSWMSKSSNYLGSYNWGCEVYN